MSAIHTVAVIGATGHLAIPVIKEMLEKGFRVKAIVRNPKKAQGLLPSQVEIIQAELTDIASLTKAMHKTDAVYINLSMEITSMDLPFYTEREGVKNIIEAAHLNDIQQILKIGALGSYPLATHIKNNIPQNIIRIQGHQLIEQSGIPFTLFHPCSFIDNLFWIMKDTKTRWIGKPIGCHWTNSVDYARQVVAAIGNPVAMNKHYAVQGTEKLTYLELEKRIKNSFHPDFSINTTPIGLIKFIGLFNSHMKFLGQLFGYFENNPDKFYAQQTWDDLGKPTLTVEEFVTQMKEKNVIA